MDLAAGHGCINLLRRRVTAGLALAASGCASVPAPEKAAPGTEAVPLEISSYGLVFVEIRIQNATVRALVDSGSAADVRVSARLATQLGLALTPVPGATVTGLDGRPLAVQRGHVPQWSVGREVLHDQPVEVAGQRIEAISRQVGTDFDAVLGWSFLARQDQLFDFAARRWYQGAASLRARPLAEVALRVVQRLPVVDATVAGTAVQVLVDTGAPMCNLDSSFAQEAEGRIVERALIIGAIERRAAWRVKDLSVTRRTLGTVGTLGNNLWSEGRIGFGVTPRRLLLG